MPLHRSIAGCVLALVTCIAPGSADGATVYTCVGPDGSRTHGSQPCADGQRTAAERPFVRDPTTLTTPRAAKPAPAARPKATSRKSEITSGAHRKPLIDKKRERCERAKANRESTLERVGLKRTFDLLRRLDDEVHAACR